MAGGYMGKILFVNLSTGQIKEETPDEKLYRDFIGGYGIGARILFSRQKAGVDPLGPENILGLVTGPLTGTPAAMGNRYVAVAKSPLTGGWGDANSGGDFGPYLKFSGYDAVFFNGIADKPVYLFIDNGKAELRDAAHLWGKDAYETEDMLKAEHGRQTYVSCIGQSGEKLSLISCIITKRGAAAGRSGLGAVMGSKKLKAVAVKGNRPVPIADKAKAALLKRGYVKDLRATKWGPMSFYDGFHTYGTTVLTANSAHSGDTPVKNWGGVGVVDFPDPSGLSGDVSIANKDKPENCWQCPLVCQALLKEGTGKYKYPAGTRRPEYETQASFGTLCLNSNGESIAMANHICNAYGLDTISAGCTIAFAIECYENGLISKEDTGGIKLTWGNHQAIVAMTEKMAKREGFGDILADGVKVAAERIGKGAEEFAVHIGGQELGMHDPKLVQGRGQPSAARYQMDATPGRHTQGFGPSGFRGHVINAAGLCMFGYLGGEAFNQYIAGFMSSVTGWERSMEELLKCGERIANIRHAFNLREGINPMQLPVNPRIIGLPPQTEGPLKGVTSDIETQVRDNLKALDWDLVTAKPSKKKLLELGLDDVVKVLYP
ncbi:MAG: aldehyde ferredoxin oxidoreductase family protein [Dehalococcoidales bacterium]|nr:aldehyde ferredoxin oxidoreductase family protein [Dehalococcoidales bacterium]